jgi:glycosyltransferase involved in cell wall biosynthesis
LNYLLNKVSPNFIIIISYIINQKNKKMSAKIMIDGRNLDLEKGTGVATYARNLSYCIHELGYNVEVLYGNRSSPNHTELMKEIAFFDSNAGDIPYWLQFIRSIKESALAPFGHEATKVPITGTVITDSFKSKLPYFDAIYNSPDLFRKSNYLFGFFNKMHKVYINKKPDLMHWTYPLPLHINGIPNIYTLHDLVPLRLPYTTLDNKRKYFRLVSKIASKADHIVTVSESSKKDIIEILKIPENKITNTYQSISIPKKYIEKSIDSVQKELEGTFGIEYKKYFLFWGSIEPKKNIGRIIESYLASGSRDPLVIVGAQAWKSENELKLLYDDNIRSLIQHGNETRVKNKVIRLNYVPFPLLVSLIRGAKATLFPSLYEGFGLPVLESMSLGTPVISANTASIPEVAGDAAILVNPYDTKSITEAIRSIDSDSDLRDALIEKGITQARSFSDEIYKERLKNVYNSFL